MYKNTKQVRGWSVDVYTTHYALRRDSGNRTATGPLHDVHWVEFDGDEFRVDTVMCKDRDAADVELVKRGLPTLQQIEEN